MFDVDTPTLASATISIADGFIATDQLFVNLTDDGSGHFITSDGETTNITAAKQCVRHPDAGGSGLALALAIGPRCGLLQIDGRRPDGGGGNSDRTIAWTVNDGTLDSQTPNTDPDNLVNATILHFDSTRRQ